MTSLSSIPYFSYFHDLKNFIHNYQSDFPIKGIKFVLVLLQLSSKVDQRQENGNGASLLDKFHTSANSSFGTPLFHLTPMIENLLEGMLLRCISNPPIFRSNVFMHVMREVKSLDLTQGSTVILQDFLGDDSIQDVDWQMAQGYLLKRTINMANISADQSVPSSISGRLPLPASNQTDTSQGETVGLQKRNILDLNEVTLQESDMVTEGLLLSNSNTNHDSGMIDTAQTRAEQQEPDYSTATEESSSTENAPTKRKRKSNSKKDQTKALQKRMSKSTYKRSGTELVNKIVTKFAPTKSKAKRVRDLWKLGRSIWSNEDASLYDEEKDKREKNAFVTNLNYATKKNILPIRFVYDDGNHRMYYNDEDEE